MIQSKGRQPLGRILYSLAAILLTSWLLSGCNGSASTAPDYSEAIRKTTDFINTSMAEQNLPGLAIALVDGDRLVWARGFGFADMGGPDRDPAPVVPDTIFEIGSVTKLFTTSCASRLAARGLLDLEAPVTYYLPGFAINQRFPSSAPITVRSLLIHHSGIPGDILINGYTPDYDPDYASRMYNTLAADFTTYPVDTVGAYSNTAVFIAGEVMAAATGRTRMAEVGDELLADLGMHDSSYMLQPGLVNRMARSYHKDGTELPRFVCNREASGGIRSTVLDISRFMREVIAGGGKALPSKAVSEMLTRQNVHVSLDRDIGIGLIWNLYDLDLHYAGKVAWHDGATMTFNSYLSILLDHGLGVVVLCNSPHGAKLVHEAGHTALKEALFAKTGIAAPDPSEELPPSPPQPATPGELAALEGVYAIINSQGYDTFKAVSGGLDYHAYEPAGKEPVDTVFLERLENGCFSPRGSREYEFEFTVIGGRSLVIIRRPLTDSIWGQRFSPPVLDPAWIARIGNWKVANLPPEDANLLVPADMRQIPATVPLRRKNGLLIFGSCLGGDHVLNPLSNILAEAYGIGRDNSAVLRVEGPPGAEELVFLGLRFTKAD